MGKVFGEVQGYPIGSTWQSRKELSDSKVHAPPMGGISGTAAEGADSIVVNGGYEDDVDHGSVIIYTGAGGNDPSKKVQIADQTLENAGNAALVTSQLEGIPVRVIRGNKGDKKYAPETGLRYDGLFSINDHWSEIGKSGYRIWRFRLEQINENETSDFVDSLPKGNISPGKVRSVVTKTVRDNEVSRAIKKLYQHRCQICNILLEVPGGAIAEGAHIRGLGSPHNGSDTTDNMLCLCPNHHSIFDAGGIFLTDQFEVNDQFGNLIGILTVHPKHSIETQNVRYHRGTWGH